MTASTGANGSASAPRWKTSSGGFVTCCGVTGCCSGATRPTGKRVLDFGCMDGVFTIALHRRGAIATRYDIAPAAIAQARDFVGDAGQPAFATQMPESGQLHLG